MVISEDDALVRDLTEKVIYVATLTRQRQARARSDKRWLRLMSSRRQGGDSSCHYESGLVRGQPVTGSRVRSDSMACRMVTRISHDTQVWGYGGRMAELLGVLTGQESDALLVFEVDRIEVHDDLVLASSDPARTVDRARVTLEEALSGLRPSLHKVLALLKEMSPDQAELEFGLKIGGETGIIIAKGTAEANFAVRMSWKSEQPDAAP